MSDTVTQTAASSTPVRCLVIQLARLGDTLQSLMALRAAKQLYPQLEIHFVCRERFSAAARRVPWISQVTTLPTDTLIGPVLTGEKRESAALAEVARWVAPLVRETWDLVVNWSYSEASSYLTGLVPSRVKLGYSRRRDTSFAAADGWSHYIQAVVQGGVAQNIHLTDILTTQLLTALQIHVGDPANDGSSAVTSKTFFSVDPTSTENGSGRSWSWRDLSKKWVAIQLGAGSDSKTWSPESWAKLASFILRRHPETNLVLLGGQADVARAKRFSAALELKAQDRRRVLSLVGETDFDLWTSVVSSAQWLLAGDTAAIHLASVLGTRVLNVSVGPVRWTETGPYGNGHYVVSSALPCAACLNRDSGKEHSCRSDVTPEAVYGTWSYGAAEWTHRRQQTLETHFSALGWTSHLEAVRIHRARIRGTADGGGATYEAMLSRPLRIEDWCGMVMGHVARAWYCGWVPPVGQELKRPMIGTDLIKRLREIDESSGVMAKICEEAGRTAASLTVRSARLRSDKVMQIQERDELRDLGRKLMELDALVERLGKTHPAMLAFSQMSKVLMHNLRGSHLADLGRESASCYRQLNEGVTILRAWVKHTLDLAKPVAVVRSAAARAEEAET
jgi:ADP-heptose:LPS heptosyltransferase